MSSTHKEPNTSSAVQELEREIAFYSDLIKNHEQSLKTRRIVTHSAVSNINAAGQNRNSNVFQKNNFTKLNKTYVNASVYPQTNQSTRSNLLSNPNNFSLKNQNVLGNSKKRTVMPLSSSQSKSYRSSQGKSLHSYQRTVLPPESSFSKNVQKERTVIKPNTVAKLGCSAIPNATKQISSSNPLDISKQYPRATRSSKSVSHSLVSEIMKLTQQLKEKSQNLNKNESVSSKTKHELTVSQKQNPPSNASKLHILNGCVDLHRKYSSSKPVSNTTSSLKTIPSKDISSLTKVTSKYKVVNKKSQPTLLLQDLTTPVKFRGKEMAVKAQILQKNNAEKNKQSLDIPCERKMLNLTKISSPVVLKTPSLLKKKTPMRKLTSKYRIINQKQQSFNGSNKKYKLTNLKLKSNQKNKSFGSKYKIDHRTNSLSKSAKRLKLTHKSSPKNIKLNGSLSKNVTKSLSLTKSSFDMDLIMELAAEKKPKQDSDLNVIVKGDSDNKMKPRFDMDLLRELAEEEKSKSCMKATPKARKVLVHRLYKSKNRIINQNASSSQARVAKSIKTKYFTLNKRHPSQIRKFLSPRANHVKRRQFLPRSRTNRYIAHHFGQASQIKHFGNNHLKWKNKKYTLTPKKMKYERLNTKSVFSFKTSTPVAKSFASRVLHNSISRALLASNKKKMTKVNQYCMFYNRFGKCHNGIKCKYIHDPSKIAVCTRFLRGTCKAENCPFSHQINPGKMAICSFYLSGACSKANCPYRHESLSADSEVCKAFVQGYCPSGKECRKIHILVCPQYIQGKCEKGEDCAFPHPPPKKAKLSEEKIKPKESVDEQEITEKVARYFQFSDDTTAEESNTFVPKRKIQLSEQPSFISLSLDT